MPHSRRLTQDEKDQHTFTEVIKTLQDARLKLLPPSGRRIGVEVARKFLEQAATQLNKEIKATTVISGRSRN